MNLHIDFANSWALLLVITLLVGALTWMCLSSIKRNEVTRVGFAHKHTAFWIESRRTQQTPAGGSWETSEPKINRRIP